MDLTLAEASSRMKLPSEQIAQALASYVRSILSGNSAFDRFVNGDRSALSPEQELVLQVFRGKGNCIACHAGPRSVPQRPWPTPFSPMH
jgi:cytochrome c peroxidase